MKLIFAKTILLKTIFLTLILIATETMYAQTNDYLNKIDDWNVATVEKGDQLEINLSYSEKKINKFQSSKQIPLSKFRVDEGAKGKAYMLNGDAGTVNFLPNGSFEFQENKAYHKKLEDQLPGKVSKGLLMIMALGNIDSEGLEVLKKEEVPLDVQGLLALSSKGVDANFLKEKIAMIKKYDTSPLTLETLLIMNKFNTSEESMKTKQKVDRGNVEHTAPSHSSSVDEEYIKMLHDMGYTSFAENDVIDAKSLGVSANYIKEIKEQGYDKLSLATLVSFKSMEITGDWIERVNKKKGVKLSHDQLISIRKEEEKGARKGRSKAEMKRKAKMKAKGQSRF